MDIECLQHCLTDDERTKFERDGFIIVENALPESMVADLIQAVDRVKPGDGGLGRDDLFLQRYARPRVMPDAIHFFAQTVQLTLLLRRR